MNNFNIRDIENLSGIKAHTLRIWEQRYGIMSPERKEGSHRRYNAEDLKQILRISFLYQQGYKISKIAAMSPAEIKRLALEFSNKSSHEVFINQLMEASIDFDEAAFNEVFATLFTHMGLEKSMVHVIYPFLNYIGILWMTGNVIPAQEHFACTIIRNKILVTINDLPKPPLKTEKKIVLFCPPGEYHEIPLLLVQYMLKKRGVDNILFGVNTSPLWIRDYVSQQGASHIFFHLITNFTDKQPLDFIREIREVLPDIHIVASGPIYRDITTDISNTTILHSMQELLEFLNDDYFLSIT